MKDPKTTERLAILHAHRSLADKSRRFLVASGYAQATVDSLDDSAALRLSWERAAADLGALGSPGFMVGFPVPDASPYCAGSDLT